MPTMDTPINEPEEIEIAAPPMRLNVTVNGYRRRIPIERVVQWYEDEEDGKIVLEIDAAGVVEALFVEQSLEQLDEQYDGCC